MALQDQVEADSTGIKEEFDMWGREETRCKCDFRCCLFPRRENIQEARQGAGLGEDGDFTLDALPGSSLPGLHMDMSA